MTDDLITSQAFVFFIAGFETSSTTMSNALYELALNQKIQNSLREEIDEVYAKYDGDFGYDNIKKMSYLDKIFKGKSFKKEIKETYTLVNSSFQQCYNMIPLLYRANNLLQFNCNLVM